LLDFEAGEVRFRYEDYAHADRKRVLTPTAREFVRRRLLHVMPTGLVRIRHSGILSNRRRHEDLALCRRLLADAPSTEAATLETVKASEMRRGPSSRRVGD